MPDVLTRLAPAPPLWVDPIYAKLGYADALPDVWVRGEIAERLQRAAEAALASGHGLLVWDGWRSDALQRTLFEQYRERLRGTSGLEGDELDALVGQFVTDPDRRSSPPAHSTGGAVDLTLCDPATGAPRDLGGEFDELTQRSHPGYYDDDPGGRDYAELRQQLADAMASAGFVRLATEWWHFEHGTALWAEATGMPVRFGRVELTRTARSGGAA
jgi:D-alanyl-D-alanine dipeptidase